MLENEPVCKKCECFYEWDNSRHPNYCDECWYKMLSKKALKAFHQGFNREESEIIAMKIIEEIDQENE